MAALAQLGPRSAVSIPVFATSIASQRSVLTRPREGLEAAIALLPHKEHLPDSAPSRVHRDPMGPSFFTKFPIASEASGDYPQSLFGFGLPATDYLYLCLNCWVS